MILVAVAITPLLLSMMLLAMNVSFLSRGLDLAFSAMPRSLHKKPPLGGSIHRADGSTKPNAVTMLLSNLGKVDAVPCLFASRTVHRFPQESDDRFGKGMLPLLDRR